MTTEIGLGIALVIIGLIALGLLIWSVSIFQRWKSAQAQLRAVQAELEGSQAELNASRRKADALSKANQALVVKHGGQVVLPAVTNAEPTVEISLPDRLALGDPEQPWGEITRFVPQSDRRLEPVPLTAEMRTSFGIWFHHAPSLAVHVAQALTTSYTMTISPEAARRIADRTWQLMDSHESGIRGIITDAQGIIRGQVSWQVNTGLQVASAVAGAWQIMAMITAQKFLADINRGLQGIQTTVDGIKRFLEQREYATLVGNIAYLRTIADTLQKQHLDSVEVTAFLNQLEQIDRDTGQLMAALEQDLHDVYASFEQQQVAGAFNLHRIWIGKDKLTGLQDIVAEYEARSKIYLTAIYVKALNAQIKCALPYSRELALQRVEDARARLQAWRGEQDQFHLLVERRAPELKSRLRDLQGGLRFQSQSSRSMLQEAAGGLNAQLEQTRQTVTQQIEQAQQPLSLVVELDEQGEIARAWNVLPN